MKLINSPLSIMPPMMSWPPNQRMAMMQLYTVTCMMGIRVMTMLSAWMDWFIRPSLASLNFCFSYSERTKAFTTRMAMRFSCTLAFSRS